MDKTGTLQAAEHLVQERDKEWSQAFKLYKQGKLEQDAFLIALKRWGSAMSHLIQLEYDLGIRKKTVEE